MKENNIEAKEKTTKGLIINVVGGKSYGDPRIQYSLIDYNGEKITGTTHISIPNSRLFLQQDIIIDGNKLIKDGKEFIITN